MKYTLKNTAVGTIEVHITAEDADVAPYRAAAVSELSKEVRIDGFRPGHAPEEKVLEKVGEEVLQRETATHATQSFLKDIVKKEGLVLIDQPNVQLTKLSPLELTITLSVLPAIDVSAAKKVSVKKPDTTPTDAELKELVLELQKRSASQKKVDRPAKKGDIVEIDFEGKDSGGAAIEGAASKHHPLELGTNTFIPGFEDALMGVKAGDTKTVELTFPKDYHATHLAGKPVTFAVTVHRVDEVTLPELNDEFAAGIRPGTTWEQMQKDMKDYLTAQKESAAFAKSEEEVVEKIIEAINPPAPQKLVEHEATQLMNETKAKLEARNMKWEDYLAQVKKDEAQLATELKDEATKRVRARLVLDALVKEKNPDITDDAFEKAVASLKLRAPKDQHAAIESRYTRLSPEGQQLMFQLKVQAVIRSFIQ